MGSGRLSNTFTTQGYLSLSPSNLQDSWVSRKVPKCCAAHREHHPCWGCFPSYLSSPLLRAREWLSPGHLAYISPKEAFPWWGHRWFAVQQQDALSRQTQRGNRGEKSYFLAVQLLHPVHCALMLVWAAKGGRGLALTAQVGIVAQKLTRIFCFPRQTSWSPLGNFLWHLWSHCPLCAGIAWFCHPACGLV